MAQQFHQLFTSFTTFSLVFTTFSLVISPLLIVNLKRNFTGETVKHFHRFIAGSPVKDSPPYLRGHGEVLSARREGELVDGARRRRRGGGLIRGGGGTARRRPDRPSVQGIPGFVYIVTQFECDIIRDSEGTVQLRL